MRLLNADALALIATWAPSTRWFPAKGREVHFEVVHEWPLADEAVIALIRASAGDDEWLLQLPVAMRLEAEFEAIIGRMPTGAWLVDACHDPEGARALVELVFERFPAECVNPPAGVKSEDWLKGGMQGATC